MNEGLIRAGVALARAKPAIGRQQTAVRRGGLGTQPTGAQALAQILADLGVRRAFGIIGGAIAPFCGAMRDVGIEIVHARHESGAAFMASEAHFASDEPVVVYTTTGPGATNGITGLVSAAWDGAKLIVIAGGTDADFRGRGAFQETRPESLDLRGWLHPSVNYLQSSIEEPGQIPLLGRDLAAGLADPRGFIATINFALKLQSARLNGSAPPAASPSPSPPGLSPDLVNRVYDRLCSGRFVIWVGFGARKAGAAIREFAERTGARVMASPRAKGIFPESHPQYLGVTGMFGGHDSVERHFHADPPEQVLVLGSRLGQSTSCFNPKFAGRRGFVHVDVDPGVFGVAYPKVETLGVAAEIGALMVALNELSASFAAAASAVEPTVTTNDEADEPDEADEDGAIHPRALMGAVQRVVVDRSDAIVMADAGNAFAWANHELRFNEARRYRIPSGFASMTTATSGVVGAAMASGKPAVALVGDGAMLMGNEVSTAVAHGLAAKWIVLNDRSYGMVRHGMVAIGMEPFATQIPATDFALLATALGATGLRVRRAEELDAALQEMLATPGPVIVDVAIDPRWGPPFGRRNEVFAESLE